MKAHRLAFLGLALLAWGGAARAAQEEEVFSATVDGVAVQAFLPAQTGPYRGILVHAANYKLDPADRWAEACRAWHFAHVAMNMDLKRNNRPVILRKALDAALPDFAARSNHPELVQAPLAGVGHSAGGMVANVILKTPERALTYCTSCAWVVDPAKAGAAAWQVPALFTLGSVPDDFKMLPAIEAQYDPARKAGAPWGLGLMWGVAHDFGTSAALFLPWVKAVTEMRLPANGAEGSLPLRDTKAEDGWLGDRTSWEGRLAAVAPFAEFKGDRTAAVWLPNRAVAYVWRAFMAKDPLAWLDVVSGEADNRSVTESPKADRGLMVPAGEPVQLSLRPATKAEVGRVKFYDGDQLLGEAAAPPWRFNWPAPAPGPHSVFAEWQDGTGAPAVTHPVLVVVRHR